MPVFERSFKVNAPLHEVAAFHDDPAALVAITPPPARVTIRCFEKPVRAGSRVVFQLGVGPFGVIWDGTIVEHVDQSYFRDVQNRGPVWRVEPHPFVHGRSGRDARERSC